MANLLHNETVARALSQAIADGDIALGSVPGLLRRVLTEDMWRKRILPETGQSVEFERFEDFVTTDPLEGLGTTLEVVKSLCKRDEDVLTLIDQVTKKTLNGNGINQPSEGVIHNTLPPQHGASREYTVVLLERDGHNELAQQVLNRQISAAEARRQAGYEMRRRAISLDDPVSAARTISKYMHPEAIKELIALLQQSSIK
ncbi:MAG: hypothetical protein ABI947_01960 [Chloroflexota bacterium]